MNIFADKSAYEDMCRRIFHTDGETQSARFQYILDAHEECFGHSASEIYSSPGRIEIIGNHTDHNGGKVLCASINFDTLGAVSSRDDGIIEIKSDGYPIIRVDVTNPEFLSNEIGTSIALVKGVVDYYNRSGKKTGGFSATMTANVPKGSGVSSSSSFELMIAEILNVKYNGGQLGPIFKAKASQYAENVYLGKPSGLMDQSAIALGGVNLVDFSDSAEPKVQKAHWAFDDLDIYVISTGGDHSNLTDDYSAIPEEMKQVAAQFGKKLLCEIDRDRWEAEKESIKGSVSERAYLRAEHFFEENERVEKAVEAINGGDEQAFIDIVNASGLSSRYKLQNTYSEKGGSHNLENALDKVVKIEGVRASRVHGGGFAGTILVLVDNKSASAESKLRSEFGDGNVFKLAIRQKGATRLIWEN